MVDYVTGGGNPGIVTYVDNWRIVPLPPKKSLGYMSNFLLQEASKNPAADVKMVQNTCIFFLA